MTSNNQLPTRFDKVRHIINLSAPAFQQVLPRILNTERFVRVALTALSKQPELQECTDESIVLALMDSARLGLEPGGSLNEAHLVKFGRTCQLIPDYRGLIKLACEGTDVQDVYAQVVRERDEFDFNYGTDRFLRHKPSLEAEPGEVIAAYCIAEMAGDRRPLFDVVKRALLDTIRDRALARSHNKGPWKTDEAAMQRKTAVKQLVGKYLPVRTAGLAQAIELDHKWETGKPGHMTPLAELPAELRPAEATPTGKLALQLGEVEAEVQPELRLERISDEYALWELGPDSWLAIKWETPMAEGDELREPKPSEGLHELALPKDEARGYITVAMQVEDERKALQVVATDEGEQPELGAS
jgi:recombination protein RecT